MPSLKDVRRRITSVQNTQKITRAMKLVAAAKLRRAQDSVLRVRPYAQKVQQLIGEIAARTDVSAHPLLARRPAKRSLLIVLTSNRGLCGAFNSNVIRAAESYREQAAERDEQVELTMIGRKGRDYFRYRQIALHQEIAGVDVDQAATCAQQLCRETITRYLGGEIDRVYLLYNEFKSAMSQQVTFDTLLPIEPLALPQDGGTAVDFIYEPDKASLLDTLLPLYVEVEIFRALLESNASEQGARMTAMDNATNNAAEMVSSLTLQYNKARQAAITKELLEIVAGAEALR